MLRFLDDHASGWRRTAVATGLTLATLGGPLLAATPPAALAQSDRPTAQRFILRIEPGTVAAVATATRRSGGSVERELPGVQALVVSLPAGAVPVLRADQRVRAMVPDTRVRLLGALPSTVATEYDPVADPNSLYNLERVVGVRQSWSKATGDGVDVALIDSGVSPVTGLNDPGKVLHGPDLSFESQSSADRNVDRFGHGTHLAGIIAGHDPGVTVAASAPNTAFLGVAPNARVVSLKVADRHGATDVSQIIAAIDWVVQHAHDPGMNVRVLNLSFGTVGRQSYLLDPLAYAAEVAWRSGIVVVTSAGNSGSTTGRLTNPAIDPFVLAVGADDTNSTNSLSDDVIPSFSSRGDGVRNPDLVAPGTHVQSLRAPGSYIDDTYATNGAINNRYFRGSGTSQAAAVVSGVAALLLQQRPGMTPDQVKELLCSTAGTLPQADAQAQGSGIVDVNSAVSKPTPTRTSSAQAARVGSGTGSLEGARGAAHVVDDGVPLNGERDIFGHPFDAALMATAESAAASWVAGTWNAYAWSGDQWLDRTWAGTTWTGTSWAGRSWAADTWAGRSWANDSWEGRSWATDGWR